MNPFVDRHQEEIGGVLSCFHRMVITGTFPDICHPKAMAGYLSYRDIRLFDYAERQLIDFFHATEYVGKIAQALYPHRHAEGQRGHWQQEH